VGDYAVPEGREQPKLLLSPYFVGLVSTLIIAGAFAIAILGLGLVYRSHPVHLAFGPTPWAGKNKPATVPGIVAAADFDKGGNDVAYHAPEPARFRNAYRPAGEKDGVFVETTGDPVGGGHDIARTTPGEWTAYTIDSPRAGTYNMWIREAATPGYGGVCHVVFGTIGSLKGDSQTAPITLPATGDWDKWQNVVFQGTVSAGKQWMRLVIDSGEPNIEAIGFSPYPPSGLSASPGPNCIHLVWTAAPGATSYTIYRGISTGWELPDPIGTSISTTFVDNKATKLIPYFYKVTATGPGGTSIQSSEASATPTTP
jgi:hypothetical protein